MNKIWIVTWESENDISQRWAFSSNEKAVEGMRREIGNYILDCIEHGDRDEALNFIEKLERGDTYYETDTDEIFIEELTIDG